MNELIKRWGFSVLLLFGLATGVAGCGKDEGSGLVLSGTVEARETVLAFQVNGRIEKLLVDEGMPVSEGQQVATLVADDYALAVMRASAEVAAAKALPFTARSPTIRRYSTARP